MNNTPLSNTPPQKSKKSPPNKSLPKPQDLVDYIHAQNGFVLRRDIARAFFIKGPDRRVLKEQLKTLVDDNTLEHRGKSYRVRGTADMTVIEFLGTNDDGLFLGCVIDEDHHHFDESVHILLTSPTQEQLLHTGDRWVAKIALTPHGLEATLIRPLTIEPKGLLGVLQQDPDDTRERLLLAPLDRKDRSLYLVDPRSLDSKNAHLGDLVEVSLDKVKGERFPIAVVQKVLSTKSDMVHHLSQMAIHRYDIRTAFPIEALDQAQHATLPTSLEDREDLRAIALVTIDDETARDHDDAVYAEPDTDPNNEGGWRLLVAIADVSAFVTAGSPLDIEAKKRGNSTYFPDIVVPMLPERLSNDLCSLRPFEDRPCLAVWMRITKYGKLLSKKFIKGLMRSHGKLTYTGVQNFYDQKGPHGFPEGFNGQHIHNLYGAYGVLKKARHKRGTLELDLPEQKITLKEDGTIAHITQRPRLDSNALIEEFMVLANVAAAEFITEKQKPCLFRIHEDPQPDRIEELRLFLDSNNVPASLSKGAVRPLNFTHLLEKIKDHPIAPAIHQMVLRSQARAVYSPENIGHFGLNLAKYAHFTSPIRRYADLTIHRAIVSILEKRPAFYPYTFSDLVKIGEDISDYERTSAKAERETVDRYIATYLEHRSGETFPARISGMTEFAVFLTLEETGSDGILPLRNLGGDYFHYDPKTQSIVGRRHRHKLILGDALDVKLEFANPISGSVLFSAQLGDTKRTKYTAPGKRHTKKKDPLKGPFKKSR